MTDELDEVLASARWPNSGAGRTAVADGDWRRFRELRDRARQRFADETLALALAITLEEERPVLGRELALERLMRRRERERRALFEDFERSHLSLILHTMLNQGLLEREELTGLSLALRRAVGLLS